jgi:hypothetical protein
MLFAMDIHVPSGECKRLRFSEAKGHRIFRHKMENLPLLHTFGALSCSYAGQPWRSVALGQNPKLGGFIRLEFHSHQPYRVNPHKDYAA